jgi:hypothetical protein
LASFPALRGETGRDDAFDKQAAHRFGGFAVKGLVGGDHPAKGRDRVALQGQGKGFGQCCRRWQSRTARGV